MHETIENIIGTLERDEEPAELRIKAALELAYNASPNETSLAHLKAQHQTELLSKVRSKDLYSNNGDIRLDAAQRAGWNACLKELRRQAEGEGNG